MENGKENRQVGIKYNAKWNNEGDGVNNSMRNRWKPPMCGFFIHDIWRSNWCEKCVWTRCVLYVFITTSTTFKTHLKIDYGPKFVLIMVLNIFTKVNWNMFKTPSLDSKKEPDFKNFI